MSEQPGWQDDGEGASLSSGGLNDGFRLGEWTVHPRQNLLKGGDSIHLEPKVMDLLVFLAERQGEVVSRQRLLDSVWSGTLVGEETLSRAISVLRKALSDDARQPAYLETIPKRGYRCVARVEALEASGRPSDSAGVNAPAGRARGFIALMVLAAAAMAAWLYRTDEAPTAPASPADPSIAVLPFINHSARETDQSFIDGIHDDLLSHIARIGSIKTISATSVRQYRNTTKTIPEIARELGVATVLEGGVQRSGTQVRINVQLIDARTDDHLWAEIYDRQLTAANIFQIQNEIATEIALALEARLSPTEQRRINRVPTESLAALEAYFLGKQCLERRTTVELARGVEAFQEAIRHDPEFALAYVGLADTYRLQSSYGDLPFNESNALGRAVVDRALELDDQLGEAHTSLANLLRRADDYPGARAAFDRALELTPNYAPAHQWYGEFLAFEIGRPQQALAYSRRAVELDPLSPIINAIHAQVLDAAGRYEEALSYFRRAIDIDPGFSVGLARAGTVSWHGLGQVDEAVNWYHQAIERDPGSPYIPAILGLAYLELDDVDQAALWIEQSMLMAPENHLTNGALARLHLSRGDRDRALDSAQATVTVNPKEVFALAILARRDLEVGRPVIAKSRYETGFPELAGPEPVITGVNYMAAVDLALVLDALGESDRAEGLRSRLMGFLADKPRLGFKGVWVTDVKIHAQRGEIDAALIALRAAADAGWRNFVWYFLDEDPSLEVLHGHPEFQAIRAELAADLKRQREALAQRPASSG